MVEEVMEETRSCLKCKHNPDNGGIRCTVQIMDERDNYGADCANYEQAEGMKFDKDKIRMDLLMIDLAEPLLYIAKVLTFGCKKYAARSWQKLDQGWDKYNAALHRHLNAIYLGEVFDADSGLPHMAHVACNALFLLWFTLQQNIASTKIVKGEESLS